MIGLSFLVGIILFKLIVNLFQFRNEKHILIFSFICGFINIMLYLKFKCTLDFIFYALIISILLVISVIDINHMIIPGKPTILFTLIIITYLTINREDLILKNHLFAFILSGLFFVLIIIISKGGMGYGDVQLISLIGLLVGLEKIYFIIVGSFILGAIISIFLLVTNIKTIKDPIAFGPFIIASFILNILLNKIY